MADSLWLLIALTLFTTVCVNGRLYENDEIENADFEEERSDLGANSDADFPYKSLRLPGNIEPIHYGLELHPNITDGKFKFTGDVRISFEVKNETDSIILHSKELTLLMTDVYENTEQRRKVNVGKVYRHQKNALVMIQVTEKLVKGKQYVIRFLYAGVLARRLRGFYRSMYKTEKGEQKFLATTHFEATGARIAFPCFDEPAMKAEFSIVMVRQSIHTALSNMPVAKTMKREDGLLTDYFQKSVKMSTYLVAFIVSEFAHLSTTSSRGIKIGVWAPKHLISQAKYAIEVTPKIMDYYEKFFQIDFPLPKQDLVAIPDFAMGAMENWGLITYRLTALLYDEHESSSANKQRVVEVIAHELAHQWFGNLVTMKWWNDLWLNEGFARFVEFIGVGVVTENWGEMTQFVTSNLQKALLLDSKRNSHPISVQVSDPADIGALFDGISYAKGASILRMMRDFIGADRFVNGLAAYLQKHKYGNAISDDLWACLSAVTNNTINVKKIMDTWTIQMGYPVVNVLRSSTDKSVAVVTQQRFLKDVPKNAKSPFNYKWEIPLTYYFQTNDERQRKWLHLEDGSVNLAWPENSGWLKVNSDEVGFYRVNYDVENWKALIKQLKEDHTKLTPSDRSNLLDDAFALASVGRLDYEYALDLTEYLAKETHYVPMASAMSSLKKVGKLMGEVGSVKYQKYILQLISPLVEKLGWEDKGSHLDKFLRGLVLRQAISLGHKGAVKNALDLYMKWMNEKQSIPANLRTAVYLAGSKYGGSEEWEYMLNQYKHTLFPSEKRLLMDSLSATSDPKILKWYLNATINNGVIRSADTCLLLAEIAGNPLGRRMTRDFVKKNWDYLIQKHGQGTCLSRVIPAVFGGKTKANLAEAEKFLNSHKLASGRLAAKQTLATIRNNINWVKRNEHAVVTWLTKKIVN